MLSGFRAPGLDLQTLNPKPYTNYRRGDTDGAGVFIYGICRANLGTMGSSVKGMIRLM